MTCEHVALIENVPVTPSTTEGCEDCIALNEPNYVHLRLCLSCGHVGCCDSSPHKHATAHALGAEHPVIRSFEPGEDWRWCYLDHRLV